MLYREIIAFAKLLISTFNLLMSVCPSIHVAYLHFHWMDFHNILYLGIYWMSVEKIEFPLKYINYNQFSTYWPMYICDNISLNFS